MLPFWESKQLFPLWAGCIREIKESFGRKVSLKVQFNQLYDIGGPFSLSLWPPCSHDAIQIFHKYFVECCNQVDVIKLSDIGAPEAVLQIKFKRLSVKIFFEMNHVKYQNDFLVKKSMLCNFIICIQSDFLLEKYNKL